MKKFSNYYKIKWSAFFITVFVLGIGLLGLYMARPQTTDQPKQDNSVPETMPDNTAGYYSNTAFGKLIEENLSELNFIQKIQFKGESEGHFSISGIFSDPERLTAICTELAPFKTIMNALKGENITINGHIGESTDGNGCFIADTITFSGHTFPAGVATSYIDEYTGLNDLLEVPVHQIELTSSGITFQKEIPTAIQIASYK